MNAPQPAPRPHWTFAARSLYGRAKLATISSGCRGTSTRSMSLQLFLAMSSAALQLTGYGLYLRGISKGEIRQNPLSWLMFSYGTGLLLITEAAAGANWLLLCLPAACASASIWVALVSRSDLNRHFSLSDRIAFAVDVALTVVFICTSIARAVGLLGGPAFLAGNVVILIASNLTTITSFAPIIRSTFIDPSRESATPWLVWVAAYSTLLGLTILHRAPAYLWIYPALNMGLHGAVGALSLRARWQPGFTSGGPAK